MLRYYSYYSFGGYKDFYLGSSEDSFDAVYYLPLLPVWEERATKNNDSELTAKVAELKKLPMIEEMVEGRNCNMPKSGNLLFSHGGYKLILEHLEGDVHALAVRDIACKDKDESGRQIPFLFIVTADTLAEQRDLNKIAAYATSNMKTFSSVVASYFSFDVQKNGLRFDLREVTEWLKEVIKKSDAAEVPVVDRNVLVSSDKNKVALLLLPNGMSVETACDELNLTNKEIVAVKSSEILPMDNVQLLIRNLRKFYEGKQDELDAERMKKRLRELGIAVGAGLLFGIILTSLFS